MTQPIASVGLLAKTGRAIAIALGGPMESPCVLARRELLLSSQQAPTTVEPYHKLIDLPWAAAIVAVRPAIHSIERLALESLRLFIADSPLAGTRVVAIGIVGSMGQDPARIGNPHIRAHAAEGQLFRQVLETAASRCGIPQMSFPAKDVAAAAGSILAPIAGSVARLQSLGKGVVQPWRSEERMAAAAAWAAMVCTLRPQAC